MLPNTVRIQVWRVSRAGPTSHWATFVFRYKYDRLQFQSRLFCLRRMFKTAANMSCTLLTKRWMLGTWLGFIETALSKQFFASARFPRTSKIRPRYKENQKEKHSSLRDKLFGFCHNSIALDKSGCIATYQVLPGIDYLSSVVISSLRSWRNNALWRGWWRQPACSKTSCFKLNLSILI